MHSPAKVLVDLLAQHGKALPRDQRDWLALTDVVLSALLKVLDNLASALDSLDTFKVHYSATTGVPMVHSVQKLMWKLQGSRPLEAVHTRIASPQGCLEPPFRHQGHDA